MFETLVSSRIRRALFEYLLFHPNEPFYLRGIAKTLGLSISPLRRELKRLEQSGMLQRTQQGSMVFYTVNVASPEFLQIKRASFFPAAETVGASVNRFSAPLSNPAPSDPKPAAQGEPEGSRSASIQTAEPASPGKRLSQPAPAALGLATPQGPLQRSLLPHPLFLGASIVGTFAMLAVVGFSYIRLVDPKLFSKTVYVLTTRLAQATAMPPKSPSSGAMRSNRWQVMPGALGGFSSGAGTVTE